MLPKVLAFLRRDFLIESSYPLAFLTSNFNAFVVIFLFFFVSKLVDPAQLGLQRYGTDYFAFTFIGYVFYQYFDQALGSFSRAIQREQVTGSLEAMLATQTPPVFCLLMSSFYYLLYAAAQLFFLLAVGFAFGLDFSKVNLPAALLVFALSVTTFVSLGIISASGIIVLKRGDPLGWLLTTSNFVLGGAFFPVEVMPASLQFVARLLPAKYALDGLRSTILAGKSIAMVADQVLVLAGMTVVLGPLAITALVASLRKAPRDGTLVQY